MRIAFPFTILCAGRAQGAPGRGSRSLPATAVVRENAAFRFLWAVLLSVAGAHWGTERLTGDTIALGTKDFPNG